LNMEALASVCGCERILICILQYFHLNL
jgi:hypothetical protein